MAILFPLPGGSNTVPALKTLYVKLGLLAPGQALEIELVESVEEMLDLLSDALIEAQIKSPVEQRRPSKT